MNRGNPTEQSEPGRPSLFDDRAPLSVRERIMARLDGDEAEDFASILAWEDEMLAFVTETATALDAAREALLDIADVTHGFTRRLDYMERNSVIQKIATEALAKTKASA